jgi:outer membrane protein insertion porin family
VYLTLAEDFLGRKSTLRLNTRAGYILGGDAPVYEQFYLGGRTLRGFDFRTVSPKGIRADNGLPSDEPVGGEWMFFAGAQYEFPLWEEYLSVVFFCDSGTVLDEVSLDDYRLSVGAGLRIYVPQFGEVPIALDVGIPILKEPTDETQYFSFSAELPF